MSLVSRAIFITCNRYYYFHAVCLSVGASQVVHSQVVQLLYIYIYCIYDIYGYTFRYVYMYACIYIFFQLIKPIEEAIRFFLFIRKHQLPDVSLERLTEVICFL